MNPFSILLIIFLLVPIIEIYLLIEVGGVIGALPTVFLVVFTAVLGAWLLRIQGFSTLNRVRQTLAAGGIPAFEMLEGLILLVAGALLLTPGFFTDTIGFLCLMPAVRRLFLIWISSRFMAPGGSRGAKFYYQVNGQQTQSPHRPGSHARDRKPGKEKPHTVIEGEFRREEDESDRLK